MKEIDSTEMLIILNIILKKSFILKMRENDTYKEEATALDINMSKCDD